MGSLKIKTVEYQNAIAAINSIRIKVFQEEQGVSPELEFDGKDRDAIQLLAYLDGEAVGTARIRAIDADTAKIERLAVLPQARRKGVGKNLMSVALKIIQQQNKTVAIVHAQAYIIALYQKLGFAVVGEKFEEAGISHLKAIARLPIQ